MKIIITNLLEKNAVDPWTVSDQAKEDAAKSGGDPHALYQELGVCRVTEHIIHILNLAKSDYIRIS